MTNEFKLVVMDFLPSLHAFVKQDIRGREERESNKTCVVTFLSSTNSKAQVAAPVMSSRMHECIDSAQGGWLAD